LGRRSKCAILIGPFLGCGAFLIRHFPKGCPVPKQMVMGTVTAAAVCVPPGLDAASTRGRHPFCRTVLPTPRCSADYCRTWAQCPLEEFAADQWVIRLLGWDGARLSTSRLRTLRLPYGKCRIKKARLRGVRNSQYPTRLEIEVETEAGSSLA